MAILKKWENPKIWITLKTEHFSKSYSNRFHLISTNFKIVQAINIICENQLVVIQCTS